MISQDNVRILAQYIYALDEAYSKLELMYVQKNLDGFEKVKRFMKEVQSKISQILIF